MDSYNQEVADAICERLVEGESLRSICRDEVMPAISTVFRWLTLHQDFSEQYARAKEEQADTLADEIIAIADECVIGEKIETNAEGAIVKKVTGDMIERSRLRVDARKWYAGKLKPKKYGDKVSQEISGPNGGPITTINTNMTPAEAAAAYAGTINGDEG